MGQKVHILSAGVVILSTLTGMALVVQAAGLHNPPAHPITGIFFFVLGLTLLIGLIGLVWETVSDDVRAADLLWFAGGGTLGCGVITFYSVGLFFLIAALNWGIVALVANRRQGRPARRGVLLALVIAGLFVLILSFMRNIIYR
jgi:hypothetical protein